MKDVQLSRRQLLAGIGAAGLAAGVVGCDSQAAPISTPRSTPTAPPPRPVGPVATGTPSPANDAALRLKIASLLVVGFRGEQVSSSDWIVQAVSKQGLGGVILFDKDQMTGAQRNIASPSQVTTLVSTLRKASPGRLIVSIDQEGGQIARLNPGDGFPATMSQAQIGAANSPAATRSWAQGMANSLKSIGVGLNYAPVVDLDVNPSNPAIGAIGRSFSADPNVVVANTTEEIDVFRAAGVHTTLKHFPGFGSASGNTDFGVVDVSQTWHPAELEPFQRLISNGHADAVLVAHLLNRQLDPTLPTSLSPKVVHDLLRVKLGFTGATVSDDMQAVAITSKFGRAQATTLAVQAGIDLLVFGNQQVYDPTIVTETVDTIFGLVRSGKVSEAQIDQSVARVDKLRPAR